jgi:hypothetical protein
MKKLTIAALVLLTCFATQAGKSYPITLRVDEEKNIEDAHGHFHFGWHSWTGGSSGGGAYGHGVTKHIFAEGSDHNAYDLVPKNRKDFIVPGTYSARFDKQNVIILVNGREIKTVIVEVKAEQ